MTNSHHESLDRDQGPQSSERAFGWTMAAAFALIALWPLFAGGAIRTWAAGLAVAFLAAAAIAPRILAPLNRAWLAFGRLLHAIVSPLIMGLLFAVAVVPTGLFLRLTGKDPLRLKYDRSAPTYWIARDPPGPAPGSMKNQF